MPQIGHGPGAPRTICGCIGQVYSLRLDGAVTVTGSSAMPHFGQLPGPAFLISGCIGHVYSPGGAVFAFIGGGKMNSDCSARNLLVPPETLRHSPRCKSEK